MIGSDLHVWCFAVVQQKYCRRKAKNQKNMNLLLHSAAELFENIKLKFYILLFFI